MAWLLDTSLSFWILNYQTKPWCVHRSTDVIFWSRDRIAKLIKMQCFGRNHQISCPSNFPTIFIWYIVVYSGVGNTHVHISTSWMGKVTALVIPPWTQCRISLFTVQCRRAGMQQGADGCGKCGGHLELWCPYTSQSVGSQPGEDLLLLVREIVVLCNYWNVWALKKDAGKVWPHCHDPCCPLTH